MYLNLLFKSIKADENQDRPVAMVRRFLQVLVSGGNSGAIEFVAGGLFLLGEVRVFSSTLDESLKANAAFRIVVFIYPGSPVLFELCTEGG